MNAYEVLKNAIVGKVGEGDFEDQLKPVDNEVSRWFYPWVKGKGLKIVEDSYATEEEMNVMRSAFEEADYSPAFRFQFLGTFGEKVELASENGNDFWIRWTNEVGAVSYGHLSF